MQHFIDISDVAVKLILFYHKLDNHLIILVHLSNFEKKFLLNSNDYFM